MNVKEELELLQKAVANAKKISEIAQTPSWKKTWSDFTPDEQQQIFDMFSKSYKKSTGESWNEGFFKGRARNWVFYGNEHGFVATRPQKSGMLKIVGSAGHPAAVDKAMQHVLQEKRPVWAAAAPALAHGMMKHYGLKSVSPMVVKQMAPFLAEHGVLGDGQIKHIENDGTIHLSYPNLENTVQKKIVGNDAYHSKIAPALAVAAPMQAYDTVKNKLGQIVDKIKN
jgi:hypothetical protein